jgi:purine-binding chemotaxis protein CheW
MTSPQTQGSLGNLKSEMILDGSISMQQMLLVRVQEVTCAIDVNYIERIIRLVELQQVPRGPQYLVGLMNYYGQNCMVVDLGIWLGLDNVVPYSLDTPIVLCSNGQSIIGFVVNEVLNLNKVDADKIQNQDAFGDVSSPFMASFSSSSGSILLLDLHKILQQSFFRAGSSGT